MNQGGLSQWLSYKLREKASNNMANNVRAWLEETYPSEGYMYAEAPDELQLQGAASSGSGAAAAVASASSPAAEALEREAVPRAAEEEGLCGLA